MPPQQHFLPVLLWVWFVVVGGNPCDAHAASTWDLISPQNFDWHSKPDRLAIAADLKSRVELLAQLLPPQNPVEVEQLAGAEAALASNNDEKHRLELELSAAFQHRKLEQMLTEIDTSLDCVTNSQTDAAEMYCWAKISLMLGDEPAFKLALSTLRDKRRLPRNNELPSVLTFPEVWYVNYARGILESILIPYLAAQASSAR